MAEQLAAGVSREKAARESRAIGHHADHVIAIEQEGIAVRKIRRGRPNHTIPARLEGATSRFVGL